MDLTAACSTSLNMTTHGLCGKFYLTKNPPKKRDIVQILYSGTNCLYIENAARLYCNTLRLSLQKHIVLYLHGSFQFSDFLEPLFPIYDSSLLVCGFKHQNDDANYVLWKERKKEKNRKQIHGPLFTPSKDLQCSVSHFT